MDKVVSLRWEYAITRVVD